MARLRVGTSSWKYDSWKGLVYDADRHYGPDDYLADYAKKYDTVEVDQWFWSLFANAVKLPEAETARRYAESVPEDFRFSVKAPNAITLTHYYTRQPVKHKDLAGKPNPHFLSRELLEKFLTSLDTMGKKLGPVMFQFEYLNKQKMGSRREFEDRLGAFIESAPKGYQYAAEVRNPKWLGGEFFAFLAGLKLGFVYLEGYYMPPIGEVFAEHRPATADFLVVRLHGKDRGGIEEKTGEVWDKIVEPHPEGLAAAAEIARHALARGADIYVNINNHFEGSAPRSVARFWKIQRSEG